MRVKPVLLLQPGSPAWSCAISAAIHGTALCLLAAGGLGSYKIDPSPRSQEAQDLVSRARDQVREIKGIETEMAGARDRRRTEYQQWKRQQAETALQDIQKRLQHAVEQQERAQEAQQEATDTQRLIQQRLQSTVPQPDGPKELLEQGRQFFDFTARAKRHLEAAREFAGDAVREQREALKSFEFVSNPDAAVRQPLEAALHQAEEAWGAQTHAIETQRQVLEYARQWQEALTALARAETQRKTAEAEQQKVRPAGPANAGAEGGRKTPVTDPRKSVASHQALPTPPQWNTLLNMHRADVQQKRLVLSQAHAAAMVAQAEAQSKQTAAQEAQRRLVILARSRLSAPPLQQTLGRPPSEVHSQGPELGEAVGPHKASSVPGHEGAPVTGARAGTRRPADPAARGSENPTGEDLGSLYRDAVASEHRSAEAERQIRGYELAVMNRMPVERVLPSLEPGSPIRPDLRLDAGITSHAANRPGTQSDAERAEEEIASILANARNGMHKHEATGHGAEDGAPGGHTAQVLAGASGIHESAARQERELAYAMEEDSHPAKDLTSVMKEEDGKRGLLGGTSSTRFKPSPQSGPDVVGASSPPSLSPSMNIQATPGRRVAEGGEPAAWMYVESWYVVGPFPNPQRLNLNRSFPPEAGVDLDAEYAGKDNRIVKWNFVQAGEPMLIPPQPEEYAVYYGYSEVWFDKPRDLWIAIGSDDKSHLWINDRLVWVSSDVLKGWRIDEGLRRVHFKQGRNRLLFRLENGWRGLGFSLVISLKP